jgi:hypothetical protein
MLDWRELRPSADFPWDRLCDALNGAGVHSVDAALSRLRLHPLHEALQKTLSIENVSAFATLSGELAAHPEAHGEAADPNFDSLEVPAAQIQRFLQQCETFFNDAVDALPAENRQIAERLTASEDSARIYCESCEHSTIAAARLSIFQKRFAEDWPVIARLLPRNDAQWALVAAWIVLGSLPWGTTDRVAAFDALQLRSALSEIFSSFGLEGEARWRAAAVVRALLLQADVTDLRSFWNDGDVRWLAGVNEAGGITYVNKESFEDLTDVLQIPALLDAAVHDSGELEAILEIEAAVEQARDAVLEAGYDMDAYLASQLELSRDDEAATSTHNQSM